MNRGRNFVYWRNPGETGPERPYISGSCPPDQVPGYGVVDHLPLPRDIEEDRTPLADGTPRRRLTTPPVFGGRYAYRYEVVLTGEEAEGLSTGTIFDLRSKLTARRIRAPMPGTTRENWWWAEGSRAWWGHFDERTPLRLITRWTGPLLEILTRPHPDREAILAEWDARISDHKSARAPRGESPEAQARRNYGPKKEGVLVLAPRPIHFNGSGPVQLFVLKPFGHRRQLGPHSPGGTRYRTPAKSMQPVCPAWLEDAKIAPPVGYAALLALFQIEMEKSKGSAHGRLAVKRKFDTDLQDWKARCEAWIDHARAQIEDPENSVSPSSEGTDILRSAQMILYQYLRTISPEVRKSHHIDLEKIPGQALSETIHDMLIDIENKAEASGDEA